MTTTATTTPTTTATLDADKLRALIRRLQSTLDQLGDGRDLRSDNEKAVWYAHRRELASVIHGLQNPSIEKPARLLAEAQAMRTAVIERHAAIEQQLSVKPVSLSNRTEIDREHARVQNLQRELSLLLRGELFFAPGEKYPQLSTLDERISALQEKVDRLQRRHAAFIDQARALLGEI